MIQIEKPMQITNIPVFLFTKKHFLIVTSAENVHYSNCSTLYKNT